MLDPLFIYVSCLHVCVLVSPTLGANRWFVIPGHIHLLFVVRKSTLQGKHLTNKTINYIVQHYRCKRITQVLMFLLHLSNELQKRDKM